MRFAPSPTGQLHVGNARTALVNWLFARQHKGTMVLRIEDTDVERSEARFEQQLLDDLKWLGIDWDEGPDVGGPYQPYRQSDRLDLYRQHAEQLLADAKAYLCFCKEEDLQAERDRAISEGLQQTYSGKCRALDPQEARRKRAEGEPAAIRLKIPEHPIRFRDIVRGDVEFPNEVVSDPIILRSSGMPVYNYVVVIDDGLMKITHVIRGDDHLSNTPKQVALYEALGWKTPEFAHLSTILGADRTRLSKRHGATSIANFRESGVLPEALMNYLALLGWGAPGGMREIFNHEELIKHFDLKRVTPSAAVFDVEKLYWLNRHYIKQSVPSRIVDLALPFFQQEGLLPDKLDEPTSGWFAKVVGLLAPAVDRLEQLPHRAQLIFRYDPEHALVHDENPQVLAAATSETVVESFARAVCSNGADELTPERFKAIMNQVKEKSGAKGKDLFHPVRIILTGSHSGPDFDKLIPILEEGSRLPLPQHVKSVCERVEGFMSAWKKQSD